MISAELQSPLDSSATNVNTYLLGPGGVCGKLEYCNQDAACTTRDSLKCSVCKAQVTALADIVNNVLRPIATYFEQTDYSYRHFYFGNNPEASSGGDFNTGWLSAYCSQKGLGASSSQCCVPGTLKCEAVTNPFQAYSPYSDAVGSKGTNIWCKYANGK